MVLKVNLCWKYIYSLQIRERTAHVHHDGKTYEVEPVSLTMSRTYEGPSEGGLKGNDKDDDKIEKNTLYIVIGVAAGIVLLTILAAAVVSTLIYI